jgi:hypothetical protein
MPRVALRRGLLVALRAVITLLFVPAISVKLRHPAQWGHQFAAWGYPAWGAVVVSLVEIAALIALWRRALAPAAIIALMCTLTGATATWLIHGPRQTAAYPGAILALVLLLGALEKGPRPRTTRNRTATDYTE